MIPSRQQTTTVKDEYKNVSEITNDEATFVTSIFRVTKVQVAIQEIQEGVSSGEISFYEANVRLSELLSHFGKIKSEVENSL